jgi:hypothetical protein
VFERRCDGAPARKAASVPSSAAMASRVAAITACSAWSAGSDSGSSRTICSSWAGRAHDRHEPAGGADVHGSRSEREANRANSTQVTPSALPSCSLSLVISAPRSACPVKADVFSGDESHRGKSQRPRSLDGRAEGNQSPEAHRRNHRKDGSEWPGRNVSERKGSPESAWPRRPSVYFSREGSRDRRSLADAASPSGGV